MLPPSRTKEKRESDAVRIEHALSQDSCFSGVYRRHGYFPYNKTNKRMLLDHLPYHSKPVSVPARDAGQSLSVAVTMASIAQEFVKNGWTMDEVAEVTHAYRIATLFCPLVTLDVVKQCINTQLACGALFSSQEAAERQIVWLNTICKQLGIRFRCPDCLHAGAHWFYCIVFDKFQVSCVACSCRGPVNVGRLPRMHCTLSNGKGVAGFFKIHGAAIIKAGIAYKADNDSRMTTHLMQEYDRKTSEEKAYERSLLQTDSLLCREEVPEIDPEVAKSIEVEVQQAKVPSCPFMSEIHTPTTMPPAMPPKDRDVIPFSMIPNTPQTEISESGSLSLSPFLVDKAVALEE